MMSLEEYRKKRDFGKTPEPKGQTRKSGSGRMFVVQKHAARRLHYDLRLEMDGVLKSWAVPKGPSYDPADKRLAVQVEDHPIDYGDFEGIIEPGQYGAGTVMVWDRGTWEPADGDKGVESGKMVFRLDGQKLKGTWHMIRLKKRRGEKGENWLLFKGRDADSPGRPGDITEEEPLSVKTGRSMEEIRADADEKWVSNAPSSPSRKPGLIAPPPPKGRPARFPEDFSPQLATLVSRAPEGKLWLHEVKFDGYRVLAKMQAGRVSLITRRGQNWTDRFAPVAEELSTLPVSNAILDGEVVIQDPDGTTNFQKLQNSLKGAAEGPLLYYVFDIPYYNGHDMTEVALAERKELLRQLIHTYQAHLPSVHYSEHIVGSGERIFKAACDRAAEGIVSKLASSPYVQTRSKSWLKVKCIRRQEFVIGGFTKPKGSRSDFGALLLGYYKDGNLRYAGKVGTGFNSRSLKEIHEKLKPLEQDRSPFAERVKESPQKDLHWTAPRLVAEVEFFTWTDDGRLRHPSFAGIREDKDASEVAREEEGPPPPKEEAEAKPATRTPARKASEAPALTHPDKVLYPEQGLTKRDLADYYTQVAERALPEMTRRPLTLVRCPEGIGGECFFQKHLGKDAPQAIRRVPIEEKNGIGYYPYIEDLNGLLSLVQLGALEIHGWGSRVDRLEYPDRMVLDLDPSPEITKEALAEAAKWVKEWLGRHDVRPFFKTTGGKGVHVVIPLKADL
ncbi:MAG TPA: DNA ligase D, partial [Thermodesulfobacteriota bacterium]|nr:DNA ligase D [Thermodesulfobacteriota bacterium]